MRNSTPSSCFPSLFSSALFLLFVVATCQAQPATSSQGSGDIKKSGPKQVPPSYDPNELSRNTNYPELARRQSITGKVIIRGLIDHMGKVANTIVDTGVHPLLDTAAVMAMRQTKFTPATENGIPVAVWIQIPFNFQLSPPAADTSAEEFPSSDEFIPVELEPMWDMGDLQKRVVYPLEARRNNVEGDVHVRALVDRNGRVRDVVVERCDHELLCQAAIDVVKQTPFTPAMQNRKPIALWILVPVKFRLE